MVQLKILRNFNCKGENESPVVIPLPCAVPDGLVNGGCSVIAHIYTQHKQLAVKAVLSSFEIIIKTLTEC